MDLYLICALARRHAVSVFRQCVVAACMLMPAGFGACAQSWPAKPITVVVPYQAGGNTDIMARLLANSLARQLDNTVLVENRGGAGGAVAADYVARAPKDGYTLLFGTTAQISIVPLVQTVRYDPKTAFEPISIFGTNANVLAVSDKVPASSVSELISYATKNPGRINYGSGGVGTVTHLAGALFGRMAGIELTHVPFRGGSQMAADLSAGHIQMYVGSTSELLPMANGVGIRLLALTSAHRQPSLNLPTVADSLPGYRIESWNGLLAPAGTPGSILHNLESLAINAAKDPATQDRLAGLGIEPQGLTSEQSKEVIAAEAVTFMEAVAAAGVLKK